VQSRVLRFGGIGSGHPAAVQRASHERGTISRRRNRTLALAMNELGARSNTGEGGERPRDLQQLAGSCLPREASVFRQVWRDAEYLVNAHELEIKIAQGSKPGEGGQLPASKVTVYIAKLRHAVPGMALIHRRRTMNIYSMKTWSN